MIKIIILIFILLFSSNSHAEAIKANKVEVYKSKRVMYLLDGNSNIIREYKIALGASPEGHKSQEGDEKTPEGLYKIEKKNEKSRFHLSLKISYPNQQDIKNAKNLNVLPGGNIMIHGLPNFLGFIGKYHTLYNKWTDGCIAVTNDEIEDIWNLVEVGTEIEINP